MNRVESETAAAALLGSGWEVVDPARRPRDRREHVHGHRRGRRQGAQGGPAGAGAARRARRRRDRLPGGARPRRASGPWRARRRVGRPRRVGRGGPTASRRAAVRPVSPDTAATTARARHGAFRTRAMLKVQDGCDARCAYCIVPSARGGPRSRPACRRARGSPIARGGGRGGARRHGHQRGPVPRRPEPTWPSCCPASSRVGPRIRLSSVEPMDLTDRLLGVMAEAASAARFCPHLHVPLQTRLGQAALEHGTRLRPAAFAHALAGARAAMPSLAVTTDVIAGLPGETAEDATATEELRARATPPAAPRVPLLGPGGDARRGDARPGPSACARRARGASAGGVRRALRRVSRLRASADPRASSWRGEAEGTTEDHLRVRLTDPPAAPGSGSPPAGGARGDRRGQRCWPARPADRTAPTFLEGNQHQVHPVTTAPGRGTLDQSSPRQGGSMVVVLKIVRVLAWIVYARRASPRSSCWRSRSCWCSSTRTGASRSRSSSTTGRRPSWARSSG